MPPPPPEMFKCVTTKASLAEGKQTLSLPYAQTPSAITWKDAMSYVHPGLKKENLTMLLQLLEVQVVHDVFICLNRVKAQYWTWT